MTRVPRWPALALTLVLGSIAVGSAQGQGMPAAVLDVRFTPSPRAQVAIWIEAQDGTFLRTLALTESVAYRGVGNRPGASEMNSGYRWPYGRREGILSIWASRRAAAPGALQFPRVIFQDRNWEGLASRTSPDHTVDDYFCLSFARETTSQDALDAVSCASVFTSDKGRYLTQADVDSGYGEPYEEPDTGTPVSAPLPLTSLYPARMDVLRCGGMSESCNDHADVARFAEDVREVIPEIDAITMATPPGGVEQSVLFSVPSDWPGGVYQLWIEVNVEGDYNDAFDATRFPTPTGPAGQWDSWAISYGYPYRGQPSVAYRLAIELGPVGERSYGTSSPEGSSSWDVWGTGYGELQPMTGISDDAVAASGSGADRLLGADGDRVSVGVSTLRELADPAGEGEPWAPVPDPAGEEMEPPAEPDEPDDPAAMPDGAEASGQGGAGGGQDPMDATRPDPTEPARDPIEEGDAVILQDPGVALDGPVGPVRGLQLFHHDDPLHSHEWIRLRLRAATSERPLHRYEVRVSTRPIVDADSFVRNGRPAKTASDDPEGAVSLMLPVDAPAGEVIEAELGDLGARTRYFVGIRAVDRLNRAGPISVAEITTTKRTFATVTPCFIATASYGSPLAEEVGVLRRVRDRYLMSHAPGRALVGAYYRYAPPLARFIETRPGARALVRGLLAPLVSLATRVCPLPRL